MGFYVKALAWTVGIVAFIVAAFVVYGAFVGKAGKVELVEVKRQCPPHVSVAARAPGAPVDDVVGIRPGFTMADVNETLLCRDEKFDIEFEPIWHTPVAASVKSRQRLEAIRPQERIAVGIVGQPEHEIAYAIFQDITYGETAVTATPEATAATLAAHYGAPHERKSSSGRLDLWWLYGPDGKPLNPPATQGENPFSVFSDWVTGSLKTNDCKKNVRIDPLLQASWSDQCGLSVHAQIEIRKEDPMRMSRYRIVSIDQARLAAAVQMYRERLAATAAKP